MLMEPGLLKPGPQGKYQKPSCTGTYQLWVTRLQETTGQAFLQMTKATFPTLNLWETVPQHVL